jgi:hypothetical protein
MGPDVGAAFAFHVNKLTPVLAADFAVLGHRHDVGGRNFTP